ncbi:hypothetical protein [Mesorhizobium sp.]|uniref:hypothetical protein n=1 Tax=Mesorhizobium sp. TaxID=1871066 RepID=UPI001221AB24|nr:hypothetical protein [Mesorhizobium sp.]TIX28887.1 MAG: hypothetical protein E5V35_00565 [Mesorhizobium sp.]
MDNVYAWRLGEACSDAIKQPAGDPIDTGWALAKTLHAKGFDIVPREKLSFLDRRETINEMCGLK